MSTKTTFKRIALVAVAALGLGVLTSVAPANAADYGITATLDSTGTPSSATAATGIAGAANYVQITVDQPSGGGTTVVTATGGTLVSTSTSVSGSGTSSVVVTGSSDIVLNVPTPTVGTITVKSYAVTNGVQAATATATVTVTVVAAAAGTVYSTSTAFIGLTSANAAATADLAAASRTSTAVYNATSIARIDIAQFAVAETTTAITNTYAKAISATITGAGSIDSQSSGATRGASAAVAAGGDGTDTLYVFPDGRSGTATITVSVNGAVVKTYTWAFTGVTTSIKEDTGGLSSAAAAYTSTVSPEKAIIGVGSTGKLAFIGYDANGNVSELAPAAIDFATSSDSTIATVSASNGEVTVTGVKSGTVTITACNTALCSAATITATTTVTIAKTTVASVAVALDKTEYLPGEKVTLTVSAKDADGAAIADGSYDLFGTALAANVSLLGTTGSAFTAPDASSIALVGGKKTYTFYAPLVSGDFVLTGTDSLAAANVLKVTGTVLNPAAETAQAAVDAAAEATDAANAATDAANAAAEAADAATAAAQDAADAVAALSTQVTELVTALRKQITALTNLVIKIQKKVKA